MRLHVLALEMLLVFTPTALLAPAHTSHVGDGLVITFVALSLSFGGILAVTLHRPAAHTTLPLR